jgi:hypothetical protein
LNDENIELMKTILSDKCNRFISLVVPQPWNLIDRKQLFKSLIRLREFNRKINNLYKYSTSDKYYGSVTSSLMLCSPSSNRVYLDHGFIEPLRRILSSENTSFILNLQKKIVSILHKPLGIQPFDIEKNRIGYTTSLIKNDSFNYISLNKYNINNKLNSLFSLLINQKSKNFRNVLGLMSSDWHSYDNFPTYRHCFNELNLNLIKRNCNTSDNIFIKFHRQLFIHGFDSQSFIDFCFLNGYNVIDIDKYIPIKFRGLIPVELLIKPLAIKKLFAEVSAALINIVNYSEIEVCMDYKNYNKVRSNEEQKLIQNVIKLNNQLIKPVSIID